MTNAASDAHADVWNFAHSSARLALAQLTGEVTIANPALGLGNLTWNGAPVAGHVLGASACTTTTRQDAYARASDLVAVYAETEPETFSWQVYWRAAAPESGVVLVDVILSYQTPLLESFPRVATHTVLPAGEVENLSGECDCVILRPTDCDWSYAEMTHPKDRGTLQTLAAGEVQLVRELGGQFLEKGVIRRLRLRGAFLPRNNDRALTQRFGEQLAAETPPLTV